MVAMLLQLMLLQLMLLRLMPLQLMPLRLRLMHLRLLPLQLMQWHVKRLASVDSAGPHLATAAGTHAVTVCCSCHANLSAAKTVPRQRLPRCSGTCSRMQPAKHPPPLC